MYSSLIILDKPRHLRYTFGSIDELEQAIQGGFINIFRLTVEGENGFRVLRDILYAGLKWEDPALTLPDIGETLFYFSGGWNTDTNIMIQVWKKVFDALDYDEWTTNTPKEHKGDMSIHEMIDEVEKIAYGTLSLRPAELYALTPREFNIILENYGEIDNYRTGMVCATIMNSQGGKPHGGGAYQVSDFINTKKHVKPMSDEQIKDNLMTAFGR